MTKEEHRARHERLHRDLDELLADFLIHNPGSHLLSTPIMQLMEWSHRQTLDPTEDPNAPHDPPAIVDLAALPPEVQAKVAEGMITPDKLAPSPDDGLAHGEPSRQPEHAPGDKDGDDLPG